MTRSDELALAVRRAVEETPVLDIHTHHSRKEPDLRKPGLLKNVSILLVCIGFGAQRVPGHFSGLRINDKEPLRGCLHVRVPEALLKTEMR